MGAPVLTSLVRTADSPYLYTAEFTHANIASGKTAGSYLLKLYDGETGGGGLLQLNGTTGYITSPQSWSSGTLKAWGQIAVVYTDGTFDSESNRLAVTARTDEQGTSASPWQVDANLGNATRVVHLIKTNPRGTPSFFRIDDGIAAGDYQLVFATTPSADYDTYFRAKNASGNDVDTDSEVTDETPHTLEVTADANTTYLEVEVQDWASAASDNPTAATFTLTHTPVAPATDGTENNPHIITNTGTDINVLSLLNLHPSGAQGVSTFFRYNNPTVGDWEIVFSTTPGQDFDSHFRAKNAAGNNVDTANETGDNTPHTLEVTTTAATTWLQFECQDWHSGANPTAATLRLNAPTTTTYTFSNYNDDTVTRGQTLTANFTGTEPAGTTYQWQFRNTSGDAWADLGNQTTRSTVIHAQAVIGREYRIQWTISGTTSSATTFATVVATAPTYSFSAYSDTTPGAGESTTASFTGTAPADISYQWQFRNSAQNAWANVAGQTTRTLSVASNAPANRQYRIRWTTGGTTSAAGSFVTVATPSSNWQLFADRGSAGAAGTPGQDGEGFRWRGAWSSTTNYAVRDLVHHNGSAWVATRAGRNNTPSGTSNSWDIYAERGEEGEQGEQGERGPKGDKGDRGERGRLAVRVTE